MVVNCRDSEPAVVVVPGSDLGDGVSGSSWNCSQVSKSLYKLSEKDVPGAASRAGSQVSFTLWR